MTGQPMGPSAGPVPLYRERTFLVLVGAGVAGAGLAGYRILRSRRRRRARPSGFVSEAILAVDLVESTRLATHHGDSVAMRARNALQERLARAAEGRGLTFSESTGDGSLMTFSSVGGAVAAAIGLLEDLRARPPDLAPGPPLGVRMGVSYGEVLLDDRGARHAAAINKAFRLQALSRESFAQTEEATRPETLTDRDRIFLDEEAARELRTVGVGMRLVGFAGLKGFSGLHRVYEVLWEGPL
jgi:class 3 adenylate cyclase